MDLLIKAWKALDSGFYEAAIIYAVKALELRLRVVFGIPDFHRAGLVDILYFAKDHGVRIPHWRQLHGLRKLRNSCLHKDFFPSREEAFKAVSFVSEAVKEIENVKVPERVKVKACNLFKADPEYRRKRDRFSNVLLFVGTFIFSLTVILSLIYWFDLTRSVFELLKAGFLEVFIACGAALIIYSLKIKRDIHLL